MPVTIHLKLFANLTPYLPPNADQYEIAPGTTIEAVVVGLGISKEIIKLIFVDGRKQALDYELQGGERVGIFPPVGGG